MFLFNLPMNLKEQAAIERRRAEEKKRLNRIFNEKYRTIGIDKISLDEQVKERQRMKNFEKQRNDAFDREMIHNNLKFILLKQEEIYRQRQSAQELNNYRRLYQRSEDAREWDLNNPNRLKGLMPIRISDDDPRLGPSSGQIFAGEDLQASVRKKLQQEQLKNYFDIQIMNKIKRDREEYLAHHLYADKQMELVERSKNFEEMENQCHRAIEMATRNFNEQLAYEAKIRADQRKIRETEEKLVDIAHTAFSDMLIENTTNLFDSRGHIVIDRWKGMSRDQLDDIRRQQLTQIDERQKINNTEKYFDQTWGQYANAVAKQATMIERQIEEDNRQVSHYLALENKRLARLQRERQDYLNSTVYCSAPTADFYQQFNTTSR